MAQLRSEPEWKAYFVGLLIPEQHSIHYAKTFADNGINETLLLELDREYLKTLNITMIGHVMTILKDVKQKLMVSPNGNSNLTSMSSLTSTPQAQIAAHALTATYKPPTSVRPTLKS